MRIRRSRRLLRVLDHLESNIDKPLALRDAATAAAMEATSFCKYFKRIAGICYADFVRLLRVSKATKMFIQADYCVKEVADAVGFRHVRTLDRAFKLYVGVTPHEFVRSIVASSEVGPPVAADKCGLSVNKIHPPFHNS